MTGGVFSWAVSRPVQIDPRGRPVTPGGISTGGTTDQGGTAGLPTTNLPGQVPLPRPSVLPFVGGGCHSVCTLLFLLLLLLLSRLSVLPFVGGGCHSVCTLLFFLLLLSRLSVLGVCWWCPSGSIATLAWWLRRPGFDSRLRSPSLPFVGGVPLSAHSSY